MLATLAQSLLAVLFLTVCVLLILLILIQKGRGGGLSGAFGGVGSYSPFGTKTGDALTWATVVLTGLYLLIAVLANYAYRPINLGSLGPAITAPAGAPAAPQGAAPAAPAPSAPTPAPAQTDAAPAAPAAPVTPAPAAEQPASTTPPASPASQPS